jgi:MFS family permease
MARFLGLMFLMNFMASLAGPFLAVYQLQDLKMSYLWFSILQAVATVATLLAVTRWGWVADRFGNRPVILMCSLLVPIIVLLWLPSLPIFFLVAQVLSGIAWAGYNLCTTNYLYAVTSSENRARYLAYWNAGMRFSAAGSAFIGGVLIGVLPELWGNAILTLFLISAVGRGLAAVGLLRSLPLVDGEPRDLSLRVFVRGVSESLWPPDRRRGQRVSWMSDAARVFKRALGQTG